MAGRIVGITIIGIAIIFAGCGGSQGVSGEVIGTPYQMHDAFSVGGASFTRLFISNNDGLCATGQAGGILTHTQLLIVNLAVARGDGTFGPPDQPGVYAVAQSGAGGAHLAAAQALSVANCEFGMPDKAVSGSVTIDALAPDLRGSLSLVFDGEGTLSGGFDASSCSGNFALQFQYCN